MSSADLDGKAPPSGSQVADCGSASGGVGRQSMFRTSGTIEDPGLCGEDGPGSGSSRRRAAQEQSQQPDTLRRVSATSTSSGTVMTASAYSSVCRSPGITCRPQSPTRRRLGQLNPVELGSAPGGWSMIAASRLFARVTPLAGGRSPQPVDRCQSTTDTNPRTPAAATSSGNVDARRPACSPSG